MFPSEPTYFIFHKRVVLPILFVGLLTFVVTAGLAKTSLSLKSFNKVETVKKVDDISSHLISSSNINIDFYLFFFAFENENISEDEKRNLKDLPVDLESYNRNLFELQSVNLSSFWTISSLIKNLSLIHLSTVVFLN